MRRFSRRQVLQAGQVAALAGGVAALELGGEGRARAQVKGTCRICTMHCGIVATVEDGRLERVEGDPDSKTRGFLCHHGWALREIVHAPERVRAPLRREGARFVEVSWDAALAEIAEKLHAVKQRFGAQALAVQTGWPFVRHPLVPMLQRFCAAFGSPNLATVASLCEASARMGHALVAGANLEPDVHRAKTLLVWGANPTFTAPPFAHAVAQAAHNGRRLIVVDPIRTELAREATLHLQPRPGTDGALALGLIQVVLAEKLFDEAAARLECMGLDELAQLASTFTPDEVQRLTGVPAEKVQRAARLFSTGGPASFWDGLGLEHHANGVQTVRALTALAAICGDIDVPGGMQLKHKPGPHFWDEPLPQLYRMETPKPAPPSPEVKPIGYNEYPLFHVYNRQAQGMLFPDAILENKPYPLRALICFGSNPLVTHPDSARMRAALEKLELLVVVDPFPSETAALAHYALPAATFAEAPTVAAGGEDAAVARSGLLREQHQSRPDWKILFELARHLGLGAHFPWLTFEAAVHAEREHYLVDPERELRPQRPAPDAPVPRWPTMSGKLELASPLLSRFGYEPLPVYAPPVPPTPEFPLTLVTGPRTRPYINSQFRHVPSMKLHQREPLARLHPEVAGPLGIESGARVRVISPRGQVELKVLVTRDVHPGCVVLPAGWASASANALTDTTRDPISGFPAFRSGIARVEPA
ncbi:MAG: molybdopterin-dependent oxidoreductase [Deltaproteobacteria bacterium]|nr:molybdopterin-dependent oxidoreductase [Deltaproteobacteria bacterium]